MSGAPHDAKTAIAGDSIPGVDPATLTAGRRELIQSRLEVQRDLLRQNTKRFTPIIVTEDGVIYDGNHGVRAAAETGEVVDVEVIAAEGIGFGNIMDVPVVSR